MTNNDIIQLLCEHTGHPSPLQPQALKAACSHLIARGLFDGTEVTDKGRVWIEALQTVPMPVQTWAVPA